MNNINSQKKEIVTYFLKKNILLSPDQINSLDNEATVTKAYSLMKQNSLSHKDLSKKIISRGQKKALNNQVKVKFTYTDEPTKRSLQDFVSLFKSRYTQLSRILRGRQELSGATSIGRVLQNKERERTAVIGLVLDKRQTLKGNFIITLEDPTGTIKVIITKKNTNLTEQAKDIVYDEVIGITGTCGDRVIFVDSIMHPDIPLIKELKKGPEEVYAAFLSDIHVGSNMFLEEEFMKFINWVCGKVGNEEQKKISSKLEYIFIIGDLVDGIGIYPGQEEELKLKDLKAQYTKFAEYISMIPPEIKIIICPGNHDAMRLAEPQLAIYPDIAEDLYSLPNVIMLSSPCVINIGATEKFSGFDVLMYHGMSFDFYASNVESIRNNGGYDRSDLIMKFMLKRRHLAPTHTSTLYIPQDIDHLVIKEVPDFFVTGHIHKSTVSNYRNITMISGSCFQATTAFQVKVGHHPEPGRVPVVNLQTRKIKVMTFHARS